MRIIAGKYKRKKLITLPGTGITRPTSDRVKESIFNILQNRISDKNILDLFAGSGALGLEALSRGAKKVFFVEENNQAANCIRSNLHAINIEKEYFHIYQSKVADVLDPTKNMLKEKVDIIFADPPYATDWYFNALAEIENSAICNKDCLVIFEMPFGIEISKKSFQENWTLMDIRKYGKTKLEIWSYKNEW